MLAVAASAHACAAIPRDEDTLSGSFAPPRYQGRTSRWDTTGRTAGPVDAIQAPPNSYIGDLVSHPNEKALSCRGRLLPLGSSENQDGGPGRLQPLVRQKMSYPGPVFLPRTHLLTLFRDIKVKPPDSALDVNCVGRPWLGCVLRDSSSVADFQLVTLQLIYPLTRGFLPIGLDVNEVEPLWAVLLSSSLLPVPCSHPPVGTSLPSWRTRDGFSVHLSPAKVTLALLTSSFGNSFPLDHVRFYLPCALKEFEVFAARFVCGKSPKVKKSDEPLKQPQANGY